MTGFDHDPDALIAALRSPALPAEQVGEDAAVSAMVGALPSAVPARPAGLRSRRALTIAAVTVASLGVGGLVAAGPGFFAPPADRPTLSTSAEILPEGDTTTSTAVTGSSSTVATEPTGEEAGITSSAIAGADLDGTSEPSTTDVECADGNHGATVSGVAHDTEPGPGKGQTVSQAAQSDCGKNNDDTDPTEPTTTDATAAVECAEGNHGATVSGAAHETEPGPGKGQTVSQTAQSDCGKNDDADSTEPTTTDAATEAQSTRSTETTGPPDFSVGNGKQNANSGNGNSGNGNSGNG